MGDWAMHNISAAPARGNQPGSQTREVRSADDIGQGIDALAAGKVAAINVLASALFYDNRALSPPFSVRTGQSSHQTKGSLSLPP